VPKVKSFPDVDKELDDLKARIPAPCAITDGHQIDDIELSTTTKIVPHKLGRPIRGYYVVRRNAGSEIWDESAGKADARTNLHLQASGPVTVSLWVY
jgi:hypothetical protein